MAKARGKYVSPSHAQDSKDMAKKADEWRARAQEKALKIIADANEKAAKRLVALMEQDESIEVSFGATKHILKLIGLEKEQLSVDGGPLVYLVKEWEKNDQAR